MKKITYSYSGILLLMCWGMTACSSQTGRYPEAQPPVALPSADPDRPRPTSQPRPQQPQQPQKPQGLSPRAPTAEELRRTGEKIFVNETGGQIPKTVHWNVGEDFAAMGIAHFTWYPPGRTQRHGNTFPLVLKYMAQRGAPAPAWVRFAAARGAPWFSRQELLRVKHTRQIKELEQYLYRTRGLQAEYIVARAKRALPRIVKAASPNVKGKVTYNINTLANTKGGWYPLIDYINFKGEGIGGSGYKGQNWGILQVLENMRPGRPGPSALNAFADSAYQILLRRVRNAPNKGEERWLPGWRNRTNTYRTL